MATTTRSQEDVELSPETDRLEAASTVGQEPIDQERIDFERSFDRGRIVAGWRELTVGFLALAMWFLLFAGGVLVGTESYITAMTQGAGFVEGLRLTAMIILFWTITNVGILSILAAILGAFGRRTRFTSRVALESAETNPALLTEENAREVCIHYASATMRGFGVYALVLSGLIVLATDALVSPTQGQYVRLAAMISVISFYAGYDPAMFSGFLDRIRKFLDNK